MSHSKERKKKDCLNCGAFVQGRYCQHCGQENVEPKETFGHMITHFFYDITHFDGSFFVTVKDLLFRPGFLSKEYMIGRRKKYLHPVRMYVFTSAVFFLVFYSLFTVKETNLQAINSRPGIDSLNTNRADTVKTVKPGGIKFSFNNQGRTYKTVGAYDSAQNSLPQNERDNWFEGFMERKYIRLKTKYQDDNAKMLTAISNKFIHTIPYMLFASLPLFALFLKLLYRRRKQFYYADHGVFLLHLYVFTFLFMLVYFSVDKLKAIAGWEGIEVFNIVLFSAGLIYTLKAMRNFYEQRWGKTILKFIVFNLLCLMSLLFLFGFFFFFVFSQA